jgi:CRP/FNR family transcriptional regulator, anaerobic regulatory protein
LRSVLSTFRKEKVEVAPPFLLGRSGLQGRITTQRLENTQPPRFFCRQSGKEATNHWQIVLFKNMISETTRLPINAGLLARLKKEGSIRSFSPDTILIDESDYIKNIPIVLTGSIKVLRQDEDGREILLYYIRPGESCVASFLGAISNSTSKIKAIVEEPTELLILPIHKAVDLIKDNPQWLEFIFQLYNKRFEELLTVVNAIAFQKIDTRLWDFLLKKAELTKARDLSITHQQIADELGTAREVISRLLKQLEREKKVALSRNKVTVLSTV